MIDAALEPLGYLAALLMVVVPVWAFRDRRPMDPRISRHVRGGRWR